MSIRLAAIKLFRRKSQLGVAIAVLAIIQATLVLTSSALPKVESQSVEQVVANLPSTEKWISVNSGDPTALGNQEIEAKVINQLSRIESAKPRHAIAFRPVSGDGSGRYQLIGADQLDQEISLLDGQLPVHCDETNCEVIGINTEQLTQVPLGFTVVGHAKLADDSPIRSSIDGDTAIFITSNAKSILTIPAFVGYPGSEIWSTNITSQHISQIGLANYIEKINQSSQELNAISTRLLVTGPLSVLSETEKKVGVLSKRILSIELSLCLIASFAIYLVARASRKANNELVRAVRRISPESISPFRFTLALGIMASFLGSVGGYLFGLSLQYVLFKNLSFQIFDLKFLILNFVTSAALIFIAILAKRKFTFGILSILLVSWLLLVRSADLDMAVTVIALLSVIIFLAINKAVEKFSLNKFTKDTYLAKRSQFVALGVATSLLISAILSASIYLDSLKRNAIDNAIFNSPLSTRVTMGGEAQPMQNNSFSDYQKYSNGADVYGVRKISSTYFQNAANSYPTLLVGVNPDVWKHMPAVKHQTEFDLTQAAKYLPNSSGELGLAINGETTLSASVSGLNEHTQLGAWFLTDRQESVLIPLQLNAATYQLAVPKEVTNLIGFQVTELEDYRARREHAVAEGVNALPAPQGTLTISNVELDEKLVELKPITGVSYTLINGPVYLSLVTAPAEIPALVDAQTNSLISENKVPLNLNGTSTISLISVGSVKHLPTVPMHFALVDDTVLTQFLAANSPELLHISEVWIDGNLKPDLRTDKELYGLKALNQAKLNSENLSPTNSKWTSYALNLLGLVAALLIILISLFLTLNINNADSIFGWHASGISLVKLRSRIAIKLFIVCIVAVISATTTALLLGKAFIERVAFDINGSVAYPPLMAFISTPRVIQVVGASLILSTLIFVLGSAKTTAVSK